MLNDFQRILGDVNWLRSSLGISNAELFNLFKTLEGNTALDSPRNLTQAAKNELNMFLNRLQKSFLLRFIPGEKVFLLILPTKETPTAALMQQAGPLEWVYLHNKQPQSLISYLQLISELIIKARFRSISLLGFDSDIIVSPIPKKEIELILPLNE